MLKLLKKKIEVHNAKDDIAIFRDGSVFAVFAVDPIDFFNLSEEKQLETVCNYRLWLNSLDYPVQIVKRAVNWNNREHLLVFKTKMESVLKKRKKDSHEALNNFREFYAWLVRHIGKNCSCKSLFYVVIPYFASSKKEALKNWDSVKQKLNFRCEESKNLLEKTGVNLKRMDSLDLENLFNSYFDLFFIEENKTNYNNIDSFAKLWIDKGGNNG